MRTETTKRMEIMLEIDEIAALLRAASILGDLCDRLEEEEMTDLYFSLGSEAYGFRYDANTLNEAQEICSILSDPDYIITAVD